jgi:hypothetical protein
MQATLNEIGEFKPVALSALRLTLYRTAEETAANNENISSTGAQKLTFIDIEALRNEGLSGRVSSWLRSSSCRQ